MGEPGVAGAAADGALATDRLVLTPLVESDADALFALESDARTWRHFPMGRWTDPRQAASFVRMSRASFARTGLGQYAVREADGGRMIGGVGVFAMAGDARAREDAVLQVVQGPADAGPAAGLPGFCLLNIGWRMEPEAWGRGLATEAARAVADRARSAWPSVPLTACVLSTNPGSAAVCRHLGLRVLWTGVTGEALRVRLSVPPVQGGASCVRWFFADRAVDPALVAARVRAL